MDKHELAAIRAEEAQRILGSTLWEQAFSDTKQAIFNTWSALPTADTENARDLHRRLKCLEQVRKCLEEHVRTGKIAQKEIEGKRPALMGVRNALNNWTN